MLLLGEGGFFNIKMNRGHVRVFRPKIVARYCKWNIACKYFIKLGFALV